MTAVGTANGTIDKVARDKAQKAARTGTVVPPLTTCTVKCLGNSLLKSQDPAMSGVIKVELVQAICPTIAAQDSVKSAAFTHSVASASTNWNLLYCASTADTADGEEDSGSRIAIIFGVIVGLLVVVIALSVVIACVFQKGKEERAASQGQLSGVQDSPQPVEEGFAAPLAAAAEEPPAEPTPPPVASSASFTSVKSIPVPIERVDTKNIDEEGRTAI